MIKFISYSDIHCRARPYNNMYLSNLHQTVTMVLHMVSTVHQTPAPSIVQLEVLHGYGGAPCIIVIWWMAWLGSSLELYSHAPCNHVDLKQNISFCLQM